MKRNQIQIAVDALKKMRNKLIDEREKAELLIKSATERKHIYEAEIKRLDTQINSLEGTNAGNGQHAAATV